MGFHWWRFEFRMALSLNKPSLFIDRGVVSTKYYLPWPLWLWRKNMKLTKNNGLILSKQRRGNYLVSSCYWINPLHISCPQGLFFCLLPQALLFWPHFLRRKAERETLYYKWTNDYVASALKLMCLCDLMKSFYWND